MPKFNVELPSELLARMENVLAEVDWNAIAARAFELELERRTPSDDEVVTDAELDRLRFSDREQAREVHDIGYWSGGQYARHVAGADELRNLAALDEERLEALFDEVPSGSWTHADRLALLIVAGSDDIDVVLEMLEVESLNGFWERAVIPDCQSLVHDPVFLEGFVEGAKDAWEQQQTEL